MKLKSNKEKRFFLKLTSVIIGLILWAIIIYTEDANFDAPIKAIPIQITGGSVLAEKDLVVSNSASIAAASITVRGRRSDIINSMGNVTATVDVSSIEAPGRYNVKINYELSTNAVYIIERRVSNVEIAVEKAEEKEFETEIIQKGINQNSGIIIESRPETEKVTVKGTHDDLSKIKHMAVYVDISDMLDDTALKYQLVALDEQYRELKPENEIYCEYDNISVTSVMHKKRILPVNIEIAEEDSEKYAFEIEMLSDSKIEVGVDSGASASALRAVLDYDEENPTGEYELSIEAVDGVYIPEEVKTVAVKVTAYPMEEQYVTVPIKISAPEGATYSAPSEITVRIKGAKQYLTAENVTATADITEYNAGEHTVEVDISFLKQAMYLVQKQYITVVLQ